MDLAKDAPAILNALKEGDFQYTVHAEMQMTARGLLKMDIISIAATCVDIKWQPNKQTYLVVGYATNGKGAALGCKLEDGVVVITVMWRHLSKKERGDK